MKRLWARPFGRFLCTILLYDLFTLVLCTGWLPWGADWLIVPLMPGGQMLAGLIGGALWGGLPGLRRRTLAAYTLLSVLLFPLTWVFLDEELIDVFFVAFFGLSCQQGAGFAIGAWCRMDCVRRR